MSSSFSTCLPAPVARLLTMLVALSSLIGCSASAPATRPSAQATLPPAMPTIVPPPPAAPPEPFPVMLGIDTLEAEGFAPIRGKTVALLTHPAGVNRQGISTIDVLRRAPGVKLAALFAVEHGINGEFPASQNYTDYTDKRTGLRVYSLYDGKNGGHPSKAQLKGIDAFIIDLQDIGSRSYTFAVRMKYAMEGCFENGVEVIVLDRPNPLGGLKVSGPLLDAKYMSGVGAFRVPYVHGLTIGELARMVKDELPPGGLAISAAARARGKLTVIPMRGWHRSMRWPETGLKFVGTSQFVQTFDATVGYAMVGLGCELSGFTHGIGKDFPFRGIGFKGRTVDVLEKEFNALHVAGVKYRRVTGLNPATGKQEPGLYVDVVNWDEWDPTELSFRMMQLACRLNPPNPFAKLSASDLRRFNIHVGSEAWQLALVREGARVNVDAFLKEWQERNQIYQQQTRKFWLYQ